MFQRNTIPLVLLITWFCLGMNIYAAPVFWETNGHYYEAIGVQNGINWEQAKAAAESRSYLGTSGHLVTITSSTENTFVHNLDGFTHGIWVGGEQLSGSIEPSGGWQWVTGEPWEYTNWRSGQPSNTANEEDALHLYYDGGWNDQARSWAGPGYIVEYPIRKQASLTGVPEYEWRRGCAPTSASMLIGYWDQNGYPSLWTGSPPVSNDPTNDNDPVNVVIEHLGDLMDTDAAIDGGGTWVSKIPKGMKDFAEEKDATYKFKAGNKYTSDRVSHPGSWFEGFSFEYLKHEIDTGCPMHVGLKGNQLDSNQEERWGHSIAVYGYQDNAGSDNDWIAVRDTWLDGNSDGYGGIIAKVESGIEYWKWVTDTSQDYYIFQGGWLHPDQDKNSVWGILESTFSSETAFEEQFDVTTGDSGGASLVTLSAAPEEMVVRLLAEGDEGNDDCLLSSWIPMAELLNISFEYAFETAGTLEILINGQLMAEVTDLLGLGVVDDTDDFRFFSEEFIVSDWGLDPDETYELEFRLLAGSSHVAFFDNLQVIDLGATPVPEPSALIIVLSGLVTPAVYSLRRRKREGWHANRRKC